MSVPLLNFKRGPGIPPLNFEGDPGVPLLNLKGVPGPTFTPCHCLRSVALKIQFSKTKKAKHSEILKVSYF